MATENVKTEPESEEENVYEVERIIDMRVEGGDVLYRVRWKGYCSDDDTWEPEGHLEDCREVLLTFKKAGLEVKKEAEEKKPLLQLPTKSDLFDADSESDSEKDRPADDAPVFKKKKKKKKAREQPLEDEDEEHTRKEKEKKKKKKRDKWRDEFKPLPAPETDEDEAEKTSEGKKRSMDSEDEDEIQHKKTKKDKSKEGKHKKDRGGEESKKKKVKYGVVSSDEDLSEGLSEEKTRPDEQQSKPKKKPDIKLKGIKDLIQDKKSKHRESGLTKVKAPAGSKVREDTGPPSSDSSDSSGLHRKAKSKSQEPAPAVKPPSSSADKPREDEAARVDPKGSTHLFEDFLLNCGAKDRAPRRPPEKSTGKPSKATPFWNTERKDSTISVVGDNRSRRMSYTTDFKRKVVSYADEIGNIHEAARHFGVDERNVRRWRTDSTLQSMPISKRANRGPKTGQNPEMEKALLEWCGELRQRGQRVSSLAIRFKALELATCGKYPTASSFKASMGWCTRFQKRNDLTLRPRNKIAQKVPAGLHEKILDFQTFIINNRKLVDYPLCRIGSMEETPMCFDTPSGTTGHEQTHYTVVLGCTADGGKLPPMVIFNCKSPTNDKFPSGVIVHQHPNGCMDEDGALLWLHTAWSCRNGALLKAPSLLIWEHFRAHLMDRVKNYLDFINTVPAFIPSGLPGMLQPLDVSVNQAFKTNMGKLWTDWMSEGKPELTATGNFQRAPLATVVKWVKEAWEAIPASVIQKSFLKCCISNDMDGTEEDIMWQGEEGTDTEDIKTEEEDTEIDDLNKARWDDDDDDDDNVLYSNENWNELFGKSDDDGEYDFEGLAA
ncbi:M-phase phosphoprotein 8 isoform X4 [Stigmatopora argus]